jgi:hypothetical protein
MRDVYVDPRETKKRLKGYEDELEEYRKKEDTGAILEYLDEHALDYLIEDEYGTNIVDAGLTLTKAGVSLNPTSVINVAELIVKIIKTVRKQMEEYPYIARWKPTNGIKNYTYHVMGKEDEDKDVYRVFNKYLRGKYPRRIVGKVGRFVEVGFVFGRLDENNWIKIDAIMPLENLIDMTKMPYRGLPYTGEIDSTASGFMKDACHDLQDELEDKRRPGRIAEYLKDVLEWFLLNDNSVVLSKRRVTHCLFKPYPGSKTRFCTRKFWKEFTCSTKKGKGKASIQHFLVLSDRKKKEFLKKRFLGMYIFQEGMLKHNIVTGDIISKMREARLTLRDLGLKEFPRFLFLDKGQYKVVASIFHGLVPSARRMAAKRIPEILLCFDNKKKHNCMCIGFNEEYGYQRIRHLMRPETPLDEMSVQEIGKKYPDLIMRV